MLGALSRPANYITPEGAALLQRELRELWRIERPRVTREVADAAALGDRSDNAEYIYGKKRLREIDRRVRFLRQRLESLEVVRPGDTGDPDKAYFGAWVVLANDAGERRTVRLVGPDEIDPARGRISVESPLGRVLLGREAGDQVTIRPLAGPARYEVVSVSYRDPGARAAGDAERDG